jgi:uncharacterized UPF0160 family protein
MSFTVATHDGDFHADEVFAVATLKLIFERDGGDEIKVVRTRDPELLSSASGRIDVGGAYDPESFDFDHHQPGGAGARDNGIEYASFGLIWKHRGGLLCDGDDEILARIDSSLVQWVDANDNGQNVCEPMLPDGGIPIGLAGLIAAFNPRWDECPEPGQSKAEFQDERFAAAVEFACGVIERELRSVEALVLAKAKVEAAIAGADDARVIVLAEKLPWREAVVCGAPEALYVVYPKDDGAWGLQAVPAALGEFANRKDLPESWAGLSGSELAAASGVADAIFCHRARFFAAAASREGALELARLALEA